MNYGLFADMFSTKEKKDAVQALEDAKIDYQLAEKRLKRASEDLFYARKSALKAIEKAESDLKRRRDFSTKNVTEIAIARASIRNFTETIQKESQLPDTEYYSEKRDNLIIGSTMGVLGIGFGTLSKIFPPVMLAIGIGAAIFAFGSDSGYDKINKQKSEITRITNIIQQRIREIDDLRYNIEENTHKLNKYLNKGTSDYQKIVNTIKSLCLDINKKFDI